MKHKKTLKTQFSNKQIKTKDGFKIQTNEQTNLNRHFPKDINGQLGYSKIFHFLSHVKNAHKNHINPSIPERLTKGELLVRQRLAWATKETTVLIFTRWLSPQRQC